MPAVAPVISTVLADINVKAIKTGEPGALEVIRHSAAHVMAQAVQQLRPGAKLGIGPYITDGCYSEFDVEEPFTPEALASALLAGLAWCLGLALFCRRLGLLLGRAIWRRPRPPSLRNAAGK